MKNRFRFVAIFCLAAIPLVGLAGPGQADERANLTRKSLAAEQALKDQSAGTRELVDKAKAVLVFPEITKVGAILGGTAGEGVLLQNGSALGHYKLVNGSVGLTLGMTQYSQAILFMTSESLRAFQSASGWEIGGDLSVAMVDVGAGGQLDSKNIDSSVITIVWGQNGLMADASVKGGKIEKID